MPELANRQILPAAHPVGTHKESHFRAGAGWMEWRHHSDWSSCCAGTTSASGWSGRPRNQRTG